MASLLSPTDGIVRPFLTRRRSRNRVGDVDRALLANWYVVQVQHGDRNPARTLADAYPETSYKTWANLFSQMRSQRPALLTEAPRRGVAGGWLTDHGERLVGMAVPEAIRVEYEAGREVYKDLRHERRTAMPKRSHFASVKEYDAAFDVWEVTLQWVASFESGPDTFEGWEDWVDRMEDSVRSGARAPL